MQLPDELVEYQFNCALAPPVESWTPLAEMESKHLILPARLRALMPQLERVKSQVASERELAAPPPELRPLDAGFIMLPSQYLEDHRRRGADSELGRILAIAERLRSAADRIVVLASGGSALGARAIVEALTSRWHNELPDQQRLGSPRIYFDGDSFDTDATQDLLDLLDAACVDPEVRDECWAAIVVNRTGDVLESSAAYRIFRTEAGRYYGSNASKRRQFFAPITGSSGRFRDLLRAEGYSDAEILTIPETVADRFSAFSAAGLLPAAAAGLDVRALLLGAAAMTRRFLEEPFERNPALQYAAVNYLLSEEFGKTTRILAVWSKRLEALGRWHDHLVAESLGKWGRGPTPVSVVNARDLPGRAQQQHDGRRDAAINNVVIRTPRAAPIAIGMADRNEDDLNQHSRRTLADLQKAALAGVTKALADSARPTADLTLPALSEFTLGQLMQLFMLATVMEGRLMGVNPYGQPGVEAYKRNMRQNLKAMQNQ